MREHLRSGNETYEVIMLPAHDGNAVLRLAGKEYSVSEVSLHEQRLSFVFEGKRHSFDVCVEPRRVQLKRNALYYSFGRIEEGSEDLGSQGAEVLLSRMPGTVLRTLVEPGSHVSRGQALVILEAMKMEHEIEAPADGVVYGFPHAEGSRVMPGDLLVEFSADEQG